MRSFHVDALAAIGGLDREQVEELVGDPGFPVYAAARSGADRLFVAPDLFNIGLAGALHRLGLNLFAIRDVVVSLGACEIDAQGWPSEMFPGQRREKFTPALIVVRPVGGAFAASLVSPSELWAAIAAYDAGASLVVDATALAERIARAVEEAGAPLLLPKRGPSLL